MTKKYSPSTKGFYVDDVHTEEQIPADAVEVTDDLYTALFAAQSQGQVITAGADGMPVAVPRPAPTSAQIASALAAAVQVHVDATAQGLGYDNILAAISYADEPAVPRFQAEGAALRAWRSAVWAAANIVLDAVAAGGAVPLAADLVASLPKFAAPA